jgi:alkylhydroperoxidase family enzyme
VLGRSAGITDEQLRHLVSDPLPKGLFTDREAALVRFAQVSTRDIGIPQDLYDELARHCTPQEIMEAVFLVGLSGLVNRFHATFLTDVDPETLTALEEGTGAGGSCPIPLPRPAT